MRNRRTLAGLVAVSMAVSAAPADTVTWIGLNSDAENTYNQADDLFAWDLLRVPGPGDHALFWFIRDQTTYSDWHDLFGTNYVGDIFINGDFNPDHMTIDANAPSSPHSAAVIHIQKDLVLESLNLHYGWSSAEENLGAFRIQSGHSVTLTGENPLLLGASWSSFGTIRIDEGAALRFHGENQTLLHPDNDRLWSYHWQRPFGGSGDVEFTYAGATITLSAPQPGGEDAILYFGNRFTNNEADLAQASNTLHVRSDQTWLNPAGNAFILFQPGHGHGLIESIDGGSLNMGEVPLVVYSPKSHTSPTPEQEDGVTLAGGTYKSLNMVGPADSPDRTINYLRATGDLSFAGGAVHRRAEGDAEGLPTVDENFSLIVGARDRAGWRLNLDGHDLTTELGVLVHKPEGEGLFAGGWASDSRTHNLILAQGSTLTIGGDLVYDDTHRPGMGTLPASDDARRAGIVGDAGTTINLLGHFEPRTRSVTGGGLHESTVNLIGGTSETPNTFEAASDAADAIDAGTFAIGDLHVGTTSDAAYIQIVNNWLNDNDPTNENSSTRVKDGEVVLSQNLSIAAGSTLDVNGQGVAIWGSLSIDATGTLDLNTGVTLNDEDIVTSFFGVGNQAAAWNAVASQVMDSSNPDAEFSAIFQNDNTYWQVGEATGPLLGDMNLDGVVDAVDVAPFVLALTN
ncbi:MAG: hypothetical protein WD009_13495, partial [Phycisphaeraceae bacterium]